MAYEKAEACRCWDKICKISLDIWTLQVVLECKFIYIWNFQDYPEVPKNSDGMKYRGYVLQRLCR
jgi:hypothetical protein